MACLSASRFGFLAVRSCAVIQPTPSSDRISPASSNVLLRNMTTLQRKVSIVTNFLNGPSGPLNLGISVKHTFRARCGEPDVKRNDTVLRTTILRRRRSTRQHNVMETRKLTGHVTLARVAGDWTVSTRTGRET